MTTLIVYSSTAGNTKTVAEYIASKISDSECMSIKNVSNIDVSSYEKIIIGSRIHAGSVSGDIVSFINTNKDKLEGKTSYFLCCVFSGEKGDKQCASICEKLGILSAAYFVGGKKQVSENTEKIDKFIASI